MANNLNRVTISGRLTKDVALNRTKNGSNTVSFVIGCNYYAGKNEPKASCFFPVRAFGSNADFISKYFRKGDEIYVDGVLREDRWKKEGQYCSTTYILAYDVFFGTRKQPRGQEDPVQPHDGIPVLPEPGDEDLIRVEDEGDLPF
jgi:single-strand DNA-binding protein